MANRKNNTGLAMIIGAAAGVAAGLWLNTTKGKLWRKKVSEQAKDASQVANEYAQTAKGTVNEYSAKAKEQVNHISSTVKTEASNLKGKANEYVQQGKDALKKQASSFENKTASNNATEAIREGVEKAKQRLQSLDAQVDNSL